MPNPNKHDQPAEGGEETVDRALKKEANKQSGQHSKSSNPSKPKPGKDDKNKR